MAEPTLYLFDGYNLLHASGFTDVRELRDRLASFVALRGARGILVFDGEGGDETYGPLQVRFAAHADALLERLAAEHRDTESICLVSSDLAVRGTAGQQVRTMSSRLFAKELDETAPAMPPAAIPRGPLSDRLDEKTRARLERLRRGED
jgi:predicted RNA-binding protein with PIN domain